MPAPRERMLSTFSWQPAMTSSCSPKSASRPSSRWVRAPAPSARAPLAPWGTPAT